MKQQFSACFIPFHSRYHFLKYINLLRWFTNQIYFAENNIMSQMLLTALAYRSNQRHRKSTTFSLVYDRIVNVYYHICKTLSEKQNYFTTEFSSGTFSIL